MVSRMNDHAKLEAMLPLWVNGTLDAAQRALVDGALADDPALAAQARLLSCIRDDMQADADIASPGEFGLARLRRAIAVEVPRTNPWRHALGGAVAASVLIAGAIFAFDRMSAGPDGDTYLQASGDARTDTILVRFRNDARQGDIAALLYASHLTVVDGPSALGLYQVRPDDGTELAAAIGILRAQDALVLTADPTQ